MGVRLKLEGMYSVAIALCASYRTLKSSRL